MSSDNSARPEGPAGEAPLNPAMKQTRDKTYDPKLEGSDPLESVSVKKDEGRHWPTIWAAAAVIGVIVVIILFVF